MSLTRVASRATTTLLGAWLLAAASTPALAQNDRTLLVNLTTDDVWTSQMAFGYANAVLDAGHDVVLFLNVRAVTLANADIPQHTEGLRGRTAREELAALLERGARIFVCGPCTEQAGLSPEDWIEGAEMGGPALINIQMAPGTAVMSY